MAIDRSPAMIRVAYFMAKHGEPTVGGGAKPPVEMGVDSWVDAYRRLFPQLGDGRAFETFQGSIDKDRRHYIDCLAGSKLDSEERRDTLGDFVHLSRADQWVEVRRHMS